MSLFNCIKSIVNCEIIHISTNLKYNFKVDLYVAHLFTGLCDIYQGAINVEFFEELFSLSLQHIPIYLYVAGTTNSVLNRTR